MEYETKKAYRLDINYSANTKECKVRIYNTLLEHYFKGFGCECVLDPNEDMITIASNDKELVQKIRKDLEGAIREAVAGSANIIVSQSQKK